MNKLKYLLPALISAFAFGQSIYELQPGSKGNLFELSISNSPGSATQSVSVLVQEKPDWISFAASEIALSEINRLQKQTAQFYFDVSENAPIGEEGNVTFRITSGTGGGLIKTYNIKVTAPAIFEVQQNYPNPFNPSTTIKYSIPQDAFVSIKVFNVLGERVAELVNKDLKTGVHEVVFNAANLSSGFYFYIVEAKGINGAKYFDSKKMILLR